MEYGGIATAVEGISLLSTAYKILSNILVARLTPYVNEVTGDHQCISNLQTSRKLMTQLREKFFTIFCLNLVYLRS
jgi:hypothetical protein